MEKDPSIARPLKTGSNELLGELLWQVSRSFSLTLRLLPRPVRAQIGLAYLLARTTDTIADTEVLPVQSRLDCLKSFRVQIAGGSTSSQEISAIAEEQGNAAERVLLRRFPESLALLNSFSTVDQQLIRQVLDVITSGQELDLTRFAGATEAHLRALATDAELDDYTYRVAGCVGEFWTQMCLAHLYPRGELDESSLLQDGVRFGKGLQLVNILRDLPKDLRQGRCYIPEPALRGAGLVPADLLDPANYSRFRVVYEGYLALARSHLLAGWRYTNSLPGSYPRMRLACALPILIGLETLRLLEQGNVLDSAHRIKVSRPYVRKILLKSVLLYPFQSRWERLAV